MSEYQHAFAEWYLHRGYFHFIDMIEDVFTLIFLSVIKVKSFSFRIHGMLLPLLNDGWYIVLHTLTFFYQGYYIIEWSPTSSCWRILILTKRISFIKIFQFVYNGGSSLRYLIFPFYFYLLMHVLFYFPSLYINVSVTNIGISKALIKT